MQPGPVPNKNTLEQRNNLLLALNTALSRSHLAGAVDKQRVVQTLAVALQAAGDRKPASLEPLHELLVNHFAVEPAHAAGVVLFVKEREGRYGVVTELPTAVDRLSAGERAAAIAQFSAKRPGETSNSNPAAKRPTGVVPAVKPAAGAPSPLAAGVVFVVLFLVTFIVAVPAGLGAHEAGWHVGAMWFVRHALLLAGAVALVVAMGAHRGAAMRELVGTPNAVAALALVGGVALGLVAQIISASTSDASFVLAIALGAGIAHAVVERAFFFFLQRALGSRDSDAAFGIVLALQAVYVFTFAVVARGTLGGMLLWVAYVVVTTAAPTALLARRSGLWPAVAWHIGFVLANVGVAAS